MKYTPATLQKIEALLKALRFTLRYEKGNFQSGYCLVKDKRVVIMNKFYPTEARILAFIDLLAELNIDAQQLDAEQSAFFDELQAERQRRGK